MFKKRGKKVDVPEPRKFYFEKESLPKLYELVTTYEKDRTETNRYNMWAFIVALFPVVATGHWRFSHGNITNPCVEEVIE